VVARIGSIPLFPTTPRAPILERIVVVTLLINNKSKEGSEVVPIKVPSLHIRSITVNYLGTIISIRAKDSQKEYALNSPMSMVEVLKEVVANERT